MRGVQPGFAQRVISPEKGVSLSFPGGVIGGTLCAYRAATMWSISRQVCNVIIVSSILRRND